ncbi:MAG: alpha/beta hydrolase [Burkholderiaceae bacterium]
MSAALNPLAPLRWREQPLELEYQWVGDLASAAPVVVFLHEGLGSVSMWRDFPARFCPEHGFKGLVFSRYGYGRSTPKPVGETWAPDFMYQQAFEVLPMLFAHLHIERPWLIEQAREAYAATNLRTRLARHHGGPDPAFRGWNDVWLSPVFRTWNIEPALDGITCPVLAVQGEDDEYGTLEQIRGIARHVPHTELLVIPHCAHSPHRDQPETLSRAAGRFIHHSNLS